MKGSCGDGGGAQIAPADAAAEMERRASYEAVGNFAKIDMARGARTGFPEVVYAEGKTAAQVATIMQTMVDGGESNVMASRVSPQAAEEIKASLPVSEPNHGGACVVTNGQCWRGCAELRADVLRRSAHPGVQESGQQRTGGFWRT